MALRKDKESHHWKKGLGGFTFLEFLVVVSILLTLMSAAMLAKSQLIDRGKPEAREIERHQLAVAAACLRVDGKIIDERFAVQPGYLGILAPYVIGDIVYTWWIETDGSVNVPEQLPPPLAGP
jgi:type II secretory pathway pseudopilin PulG